MPVKLRAKLGQIGHGLGPLAPSSAVRQLEAGDNPSNPTDGHLGRERLPGVQDLGACPLGVLVGRIEANCVERIARDLYQYRVGPGGAIRNEIHTFNDVGEPGWHRTDRYRCRG